MTRIIELILTTERQGKGTEDDPVRSCNVLYTKSGRQIAFHDPTKKESYFHDENLDFVDECVK